MSIARSVIPQPGEPWDRDPIDPRFKRWRAFPRHNTCGVCREMNGLIVDLDRDLVAERSGKIVPFVGPPPIHQRCGCRLETVRLSQVPAALLEGTRYDPRSATTLIRDGLAARG